MEWNFNPVAVSVLGIQIHWYGVLFGVAVMAAFEAMKSIYKNEKIPLEQLDSLFYNSFIGLIIGARLVHCFFYDPVYYLANPLKILAIWEGGLASHGGGLGLLVVLYLNAKKYNLKLIWLLDRSTIPAALFGFFVRIGNFLNSEIIGTPTDVSWGVVFKRVSLEARHPVQLYEAFAYLILFLILRWVYKSGKSVNSGMMLGLFFSIMFIARFSLEFFKEKLALYDNDFILTTGQLLSLPFIFIGIGILIWSYKKNKD